ncbi:MAG TPA: coenzyme F420-0:L-glutamate ligase [Nocardioidaceae bacterium]|nr:coenzyme F420-0:L-glutamate ligase [Nocardioidaceae bacterium]
MKGPDQPPQRLEVWSWTWPEIESGDDLADLIVGSAAQTPLADGDVLVLTSKVVSKAEGAAQARDKADVVADESVRIVARRGATVIAETRHGLVLAAAGVDASNVADGRVLTLPVDPDGTARRLRAAVVERLDVNAGVIVSDTAGRAWRTGQVDLAIGCAGIAPVLDLRGQTDANGRVLTVTTPAVADEIASLGDLVKGKAAGRPAAVVRGLAALVLPRGDDGPGAAALVRPAAEDLFAMGAREAAVAAAIRTDPLALSRFPSVVDGDLPFEGLAAARSDVRIDVRPSADGWTVAVAVRGQAPQDALVEAGRVIERAAALAAAHGLVRAAAGDMPDIKRLQDGWRAVHGATWNLA